MAKQRKKYETKWNTKKVNDLLQDILDWHFLNPLKLTFFQFLCDHRDQYKFTRENLYYLIDKHGDAETERIMKEIKSIQEEKLMANALDNEWNSHIARFILNCNYGYIPKQQQEIQVKDNQIRFDFGNNDNDIIPDEQTD